MATPTGFQELNGSLVDLVELYEPRTSGPTGTTGFISKAYDQDLGSLFYLNSNLPNLGLVGNTGTNCGYRLVDGTDIGSLFSVKGSIITGSGLLSSIPANSAALYACKWVNNNYRGAILKIRRVGDGVLQDFYTDSTGVNIGTGINGTGMSLATWIADNGEDQTAYVHTWYDQSGNGKHAKQTSNILQPVYSQIYRNIYFKKNDSVDSRISYLIIDPARVTVFSNGNVDYTITFKTGLASELVSEVAGNLHTGREVISIGGPNYVTNILVTSSQSKIQNHYNVGGINSSDDVFTYIRTATDNEVVTAVHGLDNQNLRKIYLNGNLVATNYANQVLRLATSVSSRTFIGYNINTNTATSSNDNTKFAGSIEYLYLNESMLNDADRSIMESI